MPELFPVQLSPSLHSAFIYLPSSLYPAFISLVSRFPWAGKVEVFLATCLVLHPHPHREASLVSFLLVGGPAPLVLWQRWQQDTTLELPVLDPTLSLQYIAHCQLLHRSHKSRGWQFHRSPLYLLIHLLLHLTPIFAHTIPSYQPWPR